MKKNNPRVVVTGMGVVAPNANGLDNYSEALYKGKSGIKFIQELADFKFGCQVAGIPEGIDEKKKEYFEPDELFSMNKGITYGSIAAIDAFKDAGLKIPERDEDFIYDDTGAIVGTGIGGLDTFAEHVYPMMEKGKVKRLGSTVVERMMMSGVSARIGGLLALGNQVTTNSSACSTGTEAVIAGADRIRTGLAKRMVVGGVECGTPHIWSGFDSMKVLCRKFNETPDKASRPMSASAAGFIPGSGAGILIIEDLETAQARGAKIYAEILGSGINSGGMRFGGSMTAPSPRGVQRCVRMALDEANLDPKEIDYINGHLTATMADPIEVNNWAKSLACSAKDLPYINSTKSMTGHALGAAGGLECVATILQMKKGFVHGSLNCEDLHPDIEPFTNSIVRESIDTDIDIAIKASFGFGDVNSCIIFKNWRI